MPRKQKNEEKDERIAMLEKRVAIYEEALDILEKRNAKLVDAEEGTFLYSPTYVQMKEYEKFLDSVNKLNECHIAFLNTQIKRADDSIVQILEDNKKLTSDLADTEYFVGITNNWHEALEFEKMKKEIQELQGKIEQKDRAIKIRDEEIGRLQMAVGEKLAQKNNPGNQELSEVILEDDISGRESN